MQAEAIARREEYKQQVQAAKPTEYLQEVRQGPDEGEHVGAAYEVLYGAR